MNPDHVRRPPLSSLLLFILGLTTCTVHGATRPNNTDSPAGCERASQSAELPAAILDNHGKLVIGDIDLGNIDPLKAKQAHGYFFSDATFRLIVSPARVKVAETCELSVCVHAESVKPRCVGTSEYVLKFSLVPSKMGFGNFSFEARLPLDDPKADFDYEFNALAKRNIKGSMSIPWLTLGETLDEITAINDFASSIRDEVVLNVVNVGDRPVQLGEWKQETMSDSGLRMKESTCASKMISSKTSCSVTLVKTTSTLKSPMNAVWVNFSNDERYSFTLYASSTKPSDLHISIRNR